MKYLNVQIYFTCGNSNYSQGIYVHDHIIVWSVIERSRAPVDTNYRKLSTKSS